MFHSDIYQMLCVILLHFVVVNISVMIYILMVSVTSLTGQTLFQISQATDYNDTYCKCDRYAY